MQGAVVFIFAAFIAVVLAEGQYYVPRSYYMIDTEGHASDPVPLHRFKRSLPLPYGHFGSSSKAEANAHAVSNGWGDSSAKANARAESGGGAWFPGADWIVPAAEYVHPGIGVHRY